jgi:hypothetical protein
MRDERWQYLPAPRVPMPGRPVANPALRAASGYNGPQAGACGSWLAQRECTGQRGLRPEQARFALLRAAIARRMAKRTPKTQLRNASQGASVAKPSPTPRA